MSAAVSFLQAIPWFAWIPIVAIIGGIVTKVISMQHCHTERMAMIQAGMDPDAKEPAREEV
jgi:hypothetical protein